MEETQNKLKNPKPIIGVAAFAAFLATFNETYLNIAFTPIMQDMDVGVSTVQWLATAYMLGAAVMVPVSAFVYRSFNTKKLFCFTVSFLVVGSIVGALAPNFKILLIGRIIQSLGTGMLIPIGMNITLEAAPKNKLGSYMGIMGAMTTLGPSSSVIISGALLQASNWHVLLWVFAGLSLLCLLCGAVLLGNIAQLTHPHLDKLSVVLIGLALVGILYGISTIFSGNVVIAVISLMIGLILIVMFIKRQARLKEPLINLEPLCVKPFAHGVVVNMISLITIFSMNIIMPIFMQSNMGASAMTASLTMFPAIVLCCIVSPVAGRIYDRKGAGLLLPLGFALICIFTFLIAMFKGENSLPLYAVLYIPVICGSALIIGPVQSFALSFLSPQQNPHGVTVMSTGFQIAGCIGSSVFTGVYSVGLVHEMAAGSDKIVASSTGFMFAVVLASIFALVGFVLAVNIRRFVREAVTDTQSAPATVSSQESACNGR